MRLPSVKEIRETLPEEPPRTIPDEEIQEALELAPTVLEAMSTAPVLLREIHQWVMLSDRPEKLAHFPVNNVRTSGSPIPYDQNKGTVYPEMELSNYLLTYTVGYPPEQMPAIVAKAVTLLVRHRLLGEEDDRLEAAAAIAAIRRDRAKTAREREVG